MSRQLPPSHPLQVITEHHTGLPVFYSSFPPAVYLTDSSMYMGLPWWLSGKESTCSPGDTGLIPGLGRSPGGGHDNPLQFSCLGNPIDRGAWQATVHGVAESDMTEMTEHACSVYVNATFLIHLTFSFPSCVPEFISYVCVSIPSLEIGSSVPFF